MLMQDDIDNILDKQDGLITRSRDPILCRHGAQSKCQNCLPIDPFDEAYLDKKEIKHMSFHSYLKKLQGFKTSNLNRYPLQNIVCTIKQNCPNHKPWPKAVCDKCKPSDVTLNRQKYRHVDNISFENDMLVSRFLDSWRTTGRQRIGFLYGYYEQHTDVPLGIRAVAAAIYEPMQTANGSNSVGLNENYAQETEQADQLGSKMGLCRIGLIFTDLVPDEQQRHLVKYTRNADSYFLTAKECITAGHFQSLLPNRTQYCMDQNFGSKFVTVLVTGDSNQQVQLYGYQVSNQCAALVAADCLVPTLDAPELAYARESTAVKYVPMVNYMAKDEYGNDVRKLGRPLPVEYLMVDVPASMPKEPRFTFHASANVKHFPIENQSALNKLQNTTSVSQYCKQFTNQNMMDMVADFHFLLYLINNETLCFTLDEISGLCDAIKAKNKEKLYTWIHNNSQWDTFMHLMTGDFDHEMQDTNKPSESGSWPCSHCTYVNQAASNDCEICRLPKN